MTKKYLVILLFCLYHYAHAQQLSFIIPDSLSAKDYDYFSKNIQYEEKDSIKERLYAYSWLAKAKREKNFAQKALAYKALIYTTDKKLQSSYADSMLTAAKRTADLELIGSAYMTKGILHYDSKEKLEALENYMIADEYISKTKNHYLSHKVKYVIAQIKYTLEFYEDATQLFQECVKYFRKNNERAYLNSLHSLGLCYSRLGNYGATSQMNQTGLSEGLRLKNKEMKVYFLHSEGINQYFKHNYADAIKRLTAVIVEMKENKDFANETTAYFYIGKSYWAQNLPQQALPYLKKIDEAFQKQNYIRPDLREAYELLIDYYQQQNNKELELYYSSSLLKVDQLLHKDYKQLSGKILKEYDNKKITESKIGLEKLLKYSAITVLIGIIIIAVVLSIVYYKRIRNNRLIKKLTNPKPVKGRLSISDNNNFDTELDISPEVIAGILKNLEKFESNKKYLEKDITLTKMAIVLNTNTKYASKIISHYRGKGIIDYINDLKIGHIIELLQQDNKYSKYTNNALSDECGFGTTQKFTRAFISKTGHSPTSFINKVQSQ